MRIPDQVIDEIARRIDIVELVSGYVRLEQKGARFVGLCPFHGEKTPSFSVDRDVGAYYCFGCQRGGGVFKFLMEIEGLTFPEAVRRLGEQVGVEVDEPEEDPGARRRRALGELYNRVSGTFAHLLHASAGEHALTVLRDRALSAQVIEQFGLGYAPRDAFWLHGFLTSKGYSSEFLRDSGLFTRANPRRTLFVDRIMFPIRTPRADVVAFGGRLVSGEGPKYLNTPETAIYRKREQLFGIDLALQAIRKDRHVVLCEGYTDVIALHQSQVSNAVAPLGTAFTAEQAAFLCRYIDSATMLFDADQAGVLATRRAAEFLAPYGVTMSVAVLRRGSDPADLLRDGGSQAVRNAVSSRLTVLEFLVRQSLQEQAASSHGRASAPEAKDAVLRGVYPLVSRMSSQVQREESLRLIADLVGTDVDAVRRDFRSITRPSAGPGTRNGRSVRSAPVPHGDRASADAGKDTALSHDLFLMLATVRNRERFSYVRRFVQPDDLEDESAKEIYLALEEAFRREEQSLDTLLERIANPLISDLVRRRIASEEFAQHQEQAIHDAVTAIRRRVLLRQRRAVETSLRRMAASERGPGEDYRELLSEKMHLDRELEKLKGEG